MPGEPALEARDDLIDHVSAKLPIKLEYYDNRYIKRRIAARLRRASAANFDDYLTLLDRDEAERQALIESLSINVTGFFRNPDMWRALRPLLRERASNRRITVWSAPCADGREAYSIALLTLDDPDIAAHRVRVVGTDVSEEALATARIGEYRRGTTNDIAAELSPLRDPDRYVEQTDGTFRVRDEVRDLVEFRLHDLIHDDPLTGMDIVLCRNLLIYIHPEYESDVFDAVSSALGPDGLLVVGMTESSAPERSESFEPIDRSNRIYRKV